VQTKKFTPFIAAHPRFGPVCENPQPPGARPLLAATPHGKEETRTALERPATAQQIPNVSLMVPYPLHPSW